MSGASAERDQHFFRSKRRLGLVVVLALLGTGLDVLWAPLRLWWPALMYLFLYGHWERWGHRISRFYGHDVYIGWFLLCCGYGAWITWGYTIAQPGDPLHDVVPNDWRISTAILIKIPNRDLVVTTVIPALCVLVFTLIPAFWHAKSSAETRERWYKEIGNNSYYMGFLLTLAGLSSALVGMEDLNNNQVLGQAIAKCGAAISTTFVAVMCRVVLLDAVGRGGDGSDSGRETGFFTWVRNIFRGSGRGVDCQTCDATATIDNLKRRLDNLPPPDVDDIRFRLGLLSRAASRAVRWRRDNGQASGWQPGNDDPHPPSPPSPPSPPHLPHPPSQPSPPSPPPPPPPHDPVQRQAALVIRGYFGRAG